MNNLKGTVRVQFHPKVTKEEIFAAVDEIINHTGCLACGLRGVDLNLYALDPELERVSNMKGVVGVGSTLSA